MGGPALGQAGMQFQSTRWGLLFMHTLHTPPLGVPTSSGKGLTNCVAFRNTVAGSLCGSACRALPTCKSNMLHSRMLEQSLVRTSRVLGVRRSTTRSALNSVKPTADLKPAGELPPVLRNLVEDGPRPRADTGEMTLCKSYGIPVPLAYQTY